MTIKAARGESGATPRHRHTRRRSMGGPLAAGAIFVIAGLLFAASANMGVNRSERSSNLRELVANQKVRQDRLVSSIEDLTAERQRLLEARPGGSLPVPTASAGDRMAAAVDPVNGPGITVTLDDAPTGGLKPPGTRPDDLVVHQSDVEAVLDALWSGGAEAIAIQGQRLGATSAVKCVGNVLLLHGQVYSPPYKITAIGPADAMSRTLETEPGVIEYRAWADSVGLGWDVTNSSHLTLPAFDGSGASLRYAQVVP